MAVDTPAKIAVLGAGPIGLEAALYGRSLGYEVAVIERGRVAENVTRWGHVRMFSPFGMNRSTLGLAALAAQDATYQAPSDEELLTGRQWVERYLLPLAKTDLLDGTILDQTTVVGVGRSDYLKTELPGCDERGDSPFRLLLRGASGLERIETADVVIDTTGVFGNPNWLGRGGVPAVGEAAVRERVEFGLPDFTGADRERFDGARVLVIGNGYSAATNIVALSQLAQTAAGTTVTWVTKNNASDIGPLALIPADRLPERDRLARQANQCASRAESRITHWPATLVEEIRHERETFHVRFSGQHEGVAEFDRVLANVGWRPDNTIHDELQIHLCYASDGPMKLATALSADTSADCLDQISRGPQSLVNPEPNFYILGAKSYGRHSNFLVSVGLEQVREVFTIIGGREDLDLYKSMARFVS